MSTISQDLTNWLCYMWTTLMNHVSRSDEEIIALSGVNLVYLGPTTYGIIHDICTPQPQPDLAPTPPKPSGQTSKCAGEVTCRDSSHGHKTTGKSSTGHGRGSCGKRSHTLSESRQVNFRISIMNITPRTVNSSRQRIDYMSLNDGYEDEAPKFPKRRCKESYRLRSAPSATRLSAHKRMSSPESIAVEGDTPMDTSGDDGTLTGISHAENILPDLVVNQPQKYPVIPQPDNLQGAMLPVNSTNTMEELEAASTLLSLGDTLEDTLEEEDDNALLMPIGGANVPVDIAPQLDIK